MKEQIGDKNLINTGNQLMKSKRYIRKPTEQRAFIFGFYNLLFILFLLPLFSFSQTVSNVRFEQIVKKVHIYYDLQGSGSYTVQVYCSTDDGQSWDGPLQQVTGATGRNQHAGNNQEIIWDVLAEREKLVGMTQFKVTAIPETGIEMVFVKGGTFQMGCTSEQSDCDDDEKPAHTVTVDDFYIGKYEVTQKQWKEIMGNNPSHFKGDDLPVEKVSWKKVQKFISKLNEKTGLHYRLPTEAEWEYAARGGVETIHESSNAQYAGSNNIDAVAWYWNNSGHETHPVGTKQPNKLGIYDMSGNVWEWCSDWYDENYYGNSPQNNPQGPSSGTYRVYRGGSWRHYARYCRVAARSNVIPAHRDDYLGFRLVLIP